MSTRIKNNKPLYQFEGFHIESVKFQRSCIPENVFEYFGIKCLKAEFQELGKKYNATFEIDFKYSKDPESQLIFATEFTINDLGWYKKIENPNEVFPALFLSLTFPYIREKIYSLTDDSRGTLQMPIIDLRNTSLTTGIMLYPVVEKHSRLAHSKKNSI